MSRSGTGNDVSPGTGRARAGGALAALGAGLLVCAALPPWGWWPLALVGIAVFDRLLAQRSAPSRAARGFAFGLGWLAPGMWWMWQLSIPGYVVATLAFAGYAAVAALATPPAPPVRRAVGLAAALTLTEGLRFSFPFGGVPLATLPMGQVGSPLAGASPLGGQLLVTALTVLAGTGLSALAHRRPAWPAWPAGLALVAVPLAVAALGPPVAHATTDVVAAPPVTVAAVQGGGPQGTRAATTDEREVFARHLAATATISSGVDLVVWPENVVDVNDGTFAGGADGYLPAVAAQAGRLGAPVLVGVTEETPGGRRFLNAEDVVAPDGTVVDRYVKVRRVPFGEYLPWRGFIEAVQPSAGRLVPKDAVAGRPPAVLDVPGVGRVAGVISWEVFFGGRARDGVGAGGALLVNPTNGASYTGTIVQTQQVAASRLRARETGRWVVQVAPTGLSALVTPGGRIVERSGVSEQRVIIGEVERVTGSTPYVRYGDRPWFALAALALAGAWLLPRRSRRQAQPDVVTAR